MEEGGLSIRDIFKEGLLDMRIIRDFSPAANPIDAIMGIEIWNEKNFLIRYYEVENFEERAEVVPMYD